MNQANLEMQKRNGEYVVLNGQKDSEKFKEELKDGEIFLLKYLKGKEWDSHLQMRYYRAILKVFVPNHFNTPQEAHKHFATTYLERADIIDLNDPEKDKKIHNIMNLVSQSIKPIFEEKIIYSGSQIKTIRIKITWVKSTACLLKREMTEFINNVIVEGSNLDLYIMDGKEWKAKHGYE